MNSADQIWILYNENTKKQTKPLTTLEMQKLLLSLKIRDLDYFHIWSPGWKEWKPLVGFLESKQKTFSIFPIPRPPNKDSKKIKSDVPVELVDEENPNEPYDDETTNSMFISADNTDNYTDVTFSEDEKGKQVDYGYYFNDFKAEDIDINAEVGLHEKTQKTGIERRGATRHDFKLEIILISKNGKTFRSHSRNISMSGTLLEDPVPKDFLNVDFELMIINKFETDRNRGRLFFQGKVVGDIKNPKRLTFRQTNPHMKTKLEGLLKAYLEQQHALAKKKK